MKWGTHRVSQLLEVSFSVLDGLYVRGSLELFFCLLVDVVGGKTCFYCLVVGYLVVLIDVFDVLDVLILVCD